MLNKFVWGTAAFAWILFIFGSTVAILQDTDSVSTGGAIVAFSFAIAFGVFLPLFVYHENHNG